VKRIDVLPDDVLLEIFYFHTIMNRNVPPYGKKASENVWQPLVHVCRRWRNLVFGSPRRLNMRLFCTPKTPARDTLEVWPALPLVVAGVMTSSGTDNIIAALEQSNRVCQVTLGLEGWHLEEVLAVMQVSFPELIDLRLTSDSETVPVIPDSFLDGSAPSCLRTFELTGIPFPGLPKILLSATQLVYLWLYDTPHSGYISPEAMVALISVLSSLETLYLGFQSPQSCPDPESRRPPPRKRSILPTLESFRFKGVTEYLEDLVTFIDTPRLDDMHITFFNQIDFDCPRLAQFIQCTPTLRELDEARVEFDDKTASVALQEWQNEYGGNLRIDISCRESDWQLSSIEQLCNTSLCYSLSTIEDLHIGHLSWEPGWIGDATENTLWLQLLHPFTAVKNLYLDNETMPGIAAALQELVGGRIREVLPSLQNIFVEELEQSGPFQEKIGKFVAARQLSNHPITISEWQ
jgi:hypothetical protein